MGFYTFLLKEDAKSSVLSKSSIPNRTFENCISEIDNEIRKRKGKWTLSSISWMDFDDVAQIVRLHIYKKWSQYDQNKPLLPWLNRVITHQIKNLIRDKYRSYAKPCLNCAANEGQDLCYIYTKQCEKCPLYANWMSKKKHAHDIKLPISMELVSYDVHANSEDFMDIEDAILKLNDKIQPHLKPQEQRVYKMLYVEHKSEREVGEAMGYISNEKNRDPGYRQIKNIKKSIIEKCKKLLYDGELDLY